MNTKIIFAVLATVLIQNALLSDAATDPIGELAHYNSVFQVDLRWLNAYDENVYHNLAIILENIHTLVEQRKAEGHISRELARKVAEQIYEFRKYYSESVKEWSKVASDIDTVYGLTARAYNQLKEDYV